MEGRRVLGDSLIEIDKTQLDAYMGLLLLAGVYRSCNQATASLWDGESGCSIFRATMSLQTFHVFSGVLHFDSKETRVARRVNDKLAAIRDVWYKWVEKLQFMYNPGPEVIVDEWLVSFRGHCPFRQYMPSKPGKYGIKIWAACDEKQLCMEHANIHREICQRSARKESGRAGGLEYDKGSSGAQHNL